MKTTTRETSVIRLARANARAAGVPLYSAQGLKLTVSLLIEIEVSGAANARAAPDFARGGGDNRPARDR
ncbi:hypothetical protein V7S57_02300 [Caulobacter sp. CCNWLY153]|uniref:hypothetical protein n=1 Tax=unclassified Caulobacter TaxID=2648921 RepID=UPI002FF05FBE